MSSAEDCTPVGSPDQMDGGVKFSTLPDQMFDGMSTEQVQAHARDFRLKEFDIEVETRLEHMRAELNRLTTEMRKALAIELIKIPRAVRNLNIGVYKTKYGGNATKVREEKLEQTIQEANIMPPPPPPSVRQSSRKRKPLANKTNTAAKGTEKRNKSSASATASTRKSSRASSVTATNDAPNTASRRSSRRSSRRTLQAESMDENVCATPAVGNGAQSRVAQTPAFDPRLPCTPFLRMAKRGESIMSMNGSPIALASKTASVGSKRTTISVSLKGGKIVELADIASVAAAKKGMTKRNKKEAVDQLAELEAQIASMKAMLMAA